MPPESSTIRAGYEPIPGYRLEECIGRGGFGEVWRAEAPGGLYKAVKFVFGSLDDSRAAQELKSLERIKGVQHPFLLTLERFGVVDGRLVIVTELADGTLDDVVRRHRDRGSCGIPRSALLSYMHDAADALDYLHGNFGLQHLDIKPGNLLLVGGHVKVADFGLLKDLRDNDMSMVGGMTPIYAPPELFDGQPSLHSDQYSLAVMYQELLTGTRPFTGRTIAQLATQHVHSAPNLESLPPVDRPVVARALEKTPERRFEDCRTFINALKSAEGDDIVSQGGAGSGGETYVPTQRTADATPADVEDLPELQGDNVQQGGGQHSYRAMLVAIGATGAESLYQMRRRVAAMHQSCPLDLHSILIDTDNTTIHAAKMIEVQDSIPPCSTLYTPLRTPIEYRDRSEALASISRRWIYNVPRNRQTSGLRPLGRLALVDHGPQVLETLRRSVDHLAAVSGKQIPHIYVVASISGGTGGGMVIDVVHILRQLLDDAGMAEAIVIPILTLSNPGSGPEESLRTINSCAVLREMQHFLSAANGYPGDEGAGFPSCPAARSPLHNTYLVSTGNAQDSVTSPPQMIAQYIWEDCTAAGAILAEARKLVVDTSVPVHERLQSSVRSVGAIGLQANVGEGQHLIAPACICTLLQTWLGDPAQARQLAGPTSQRLLRRLGLVSESFTKTLLGRKGDSVRMSILERVFGKHMHEEAGQVEIEMIEQPLQPTIQRAHQQVMPEMELNNAISQIQSELAKRLEDSRTDLATAIESLELVCQHLHLMADGLNQDSIDDQFDQHFDSQLALMRTAHDSDDASEGDADTVTEDLRKLVDADDTDTDTATNSISIATQPLSHPRSRFGESESIEWPQEVSLLDCDVADLQVIDSEPSTLINRANLVLDRAVSEIASTRIDGLIASLRHLQKQLVQHGIMIARVMSTFGRWKQGKEDPWASLPSLLRNRRKTILSLLHSTLSRELLSSVVMHPDISISQEATTQRLTIVATRLVRDQLQKDVEAIEETSTTAESVVPSLPVQQVGDAIACIRPSLLQFGGWQRLLLLVSCESEMNSMRPAVEKAHDGIVSTIILQGVSPTLIFEAQQIQLNEILERWGAYLGGQASAATRLHARCDISW